MSKATKAKPQLRITPRDHLVVIAPDDEIDSERAGKQDNRIGAVERRVKQLEKGPRDDLCRASLKTPA